MCHFILDTMEKRSQIDHINEKSFSWYCDILLFDHWYNCQSEMSIHFVVIDWMPFVCGLNTFDSNLYKNANFCEFYTILFQDNDHFENTLSLSILFNIYKQFQIIFTICQIDECHIIELRSVFLFSKLPQFLLSKTADLLSNISSSNCLLIYWTATRAKRNWIRNAVYHSILTFGMKTFRCCHRR